MVEVAGEPVTVVQTQQLERKLTRDERQEEWLAPARATLVPSLHLTTRVI